MTRDEMLQALIEKNPKARRDLIEMYLDALATYREAANNINQHGAIVAHPRTGRQSTIRI